MFCATCLIAEPMITQTGISSVARMLESLVRACILAVHVCGIAYVVMFSPFFIGHAGP